MNEPEPIRRPDDWLARAEAALRDSPVPEGPSSDLVARTRNALRAAEAHPQHPPSSLRKPMIVMLKFASAASAASVAAFLSYLAATTPVAAVTAFAAVTQKLHDAHTLSYRISIKLPDQEKPATGREFQKDPGLVRTEFDPPQAAVTVIDTGRGKILSLDPTTKTAILQDWKLPDDLKRQSQDRASEATKSLRSLAGRAGKPVGKRKIGDVEAEGFRVEEQGVAWTVWFDAARTLPLVMETTFHMQDRDVPATLTDIRVDPELDDALFRLDPPGDYTLKKVDAPIAIREEALANLLRFYAEASGGSFPPTPIDMEAYRKQFPKEKSKGMNDPRTIRLAQSMGASIVFVQMELKNAYGYAPNGVRLGDAQKILFWYRPKDSQKYRAIFGDLHIEDVPADRLPEKPKF